MVNQLDPIQDQLLEFEVIQTLHHDREIIVAGKVALPEESWVVIADAHSQLLPDHQFQWVVGQVLLVSEHLVADRTNFEPYFFLLVALHQCGSLNDADPVSDTPGVAHFRVTEQGQE